MITDATGQKVAASTTAEALTAKKNPENPSVIDPLHHVKTAPIEGTVLK